MPMHHIPSRKPSRFRPSSRAWMAGSAIVLAVLWLLATAAPAFAQGSIVEEYFIPLPEDDIFDSFDEINSAAQDPVITSISIAVGGETIITYDQWEGGYEATLASPLDIFSSGEAGCPPSNPAGTQIWGNSDPCDGVAPGHGSDVLTNGDVILLENPISLPRNSTQIRFDGRDRFGSTYPVAVTRIAVPAQPGAVLSGGVEVLNSGNWGTAYRVPVGPSESGNTNPWQYTALFIMAGSDETEVMRNGAPLIMLGQGGTIVLEVDVNDLITSDKPVQADLITGDKDSSYEMRWYSLPPVNRWSREYFMPVGDEIDNGESRAAAWFYNPSQSTSITVNWQIGSDTGSQTVPAGEARLGPFVGGPDGRDGARFFSGSPFYALAQIDAASAGEIYDWGFPLEAADQLSPQVLVGNGRGCTEPGATIGGDSCSTGNIDNARSPVWIMPVTGSNVPIYIAYDGRLPSCPAGAGSFDDTFTLDALRIRTVQDPADLDMSGARIWTCVPQVNLAVAWGQDPPRSYSGDDQGLDLGTLVVPLPSIQFEKSSAFAIDGDQDGSISPGDTITFTLAVVNNGAYPANVVVEDALPAEFIYQPNSTRLTILGGSTTAIPDDAPPSTPFPLDEGGLGNIGGNPITVDPGEIAVFSYVATINPTTDCTVTLENSATVNAQFPDTAVQRTDRSSEIIVLQCNPGIDVEKSTNGQDADAPTGPYIDEGAPVTWSYEVTNIGDLDLVDVSLEDDILGPITNCIPAIPNPFAVGDSFTCTATGNAQLGQYENMATVTASSVMAFEPVSDTDPSHYFGQNPDITIVKFTNQRDANVPPGPQINAGDPVAWTYDVVNTGNVPLTSVAVTDNQGVAVACPQDALDPGESMTCTANGTAVAGQYANVGSVTGTPPSGPAVTDVDPSHYFGVNPAIDIEKSTNGEDADTPTGPAIQVGDLVVWTYDVTNTGNVALAIDVTDNQGQAVSCNSRVLRPGVATECTAFDIAELGQYANVGSVVGTPAIGDPVTDSDPSHYIGEIFVPEQPNIRIEKLTNGVDADSPTGPSIRAGDPVNWVYVVVNTGSQILFDVTVTDDQGVAVSCPRDTMESLTYMICTATGVAQAGQYANVGSVVGTPDDREGDVTDSDPSHYFGENPVIEIVKYTNGQDANTAPGPFIPVGEAVTWTYDVTNSGNVTLANISVTDSEGVGVNCPAISLAPGESMMCVGNPGTSEPGQYANVATASGLPPSGPAVQDTDPSHYFGSDPSISIEKSTNGNDADDAPGPFITPGDPVTWNYLVTNTGNVALTGVTVTDDQGVAVTCPRDTLDPGNNMTCQATGAAQPGQYANVGMVTGSPPAGRDVGDSDPSHYFGPAPSIDIEKSTNGVDADTPTGPLIVVGSRVRWLYEVTNTGNVALINPRVADSNGVPLFCPRLVRLIPGASYACVGNGTATEGQYANVGTVTATPSTEGPDVTDSDPSHYFGVESSIDLEKSTNGQDADTPTGPYVPVGGVVTWDYLITNTGNGPLRDLRLADDQLGPVTCPQTTLAVGESITCSATGVAAPGQYANTATVHAIPSVGAEVLDDDPSHYFGSDAAIDIEKATNGRDADTPTGPYVDIGDDIMWTYVVVNTGNVRLSNIVVSDDQSVAVSCPQAALAPGASMTCTANGTAEEGQYANIGSVTGSTPDQREVSDSDPSHYFGRQPTALDDDDQPGAPESIFLPKLGK